MVTREELIQCDEKEILIQLRMSVAVLEERTAHLPQTAQKVETLNGDVRWIKKVVYSAVPIGPILAGLSALLVRMFS